MTCRATIREYWIIEAPRHPTPADVMDRLYQQDEGVQFEAQEVIGDEEDREYEGIEVIRKRAQT